MNYKIIISIKEDEFAHPTHGRLKLKDIAWSLNNFQELNNWPKVATNLYNSFFLRYSRGWK